MVHGGVCILVWCSTAPQSNETAARVSTQKRHRMTEKECVCMFVCVCVSERQGESEAETTCFVQQQ